MNAHNGILTLDFPESVARDFKQFITDLKENGWVTVENIRGPDSFGGDLALVNTDESAMLMDILVKKFDEIMQDAIASGDVRAKKLREALEGIRDNKETPVLILNGMPREDVPTIVEGFDYIYYITRDVLACVAGIGEYRSREYHAAPKGSTCRKLPLEFHRDCELVLLAYTDDTPVEDRVKVGFIATDTIIKLLDADTVETLRKPYFRRIGTPNSGTELIKKRGNFEYFVLNSLRWDEFEADPKMPGAAETTEVLKRLRALEDQLVNQAATWLPLGGGVLAIVNEDRALHGTAAKPLLSHERVWRVLNGEKATTPRSSSPLTDFMATLMQSREMTEQIKIGSHVLEMITSGQITESWFGKMEPARTISK